MRIEIRAGSRLAISVINLKPTNEVLMNTSKRIPTPQGHARWLLALSGRTTFALLLIAAFVLAGTARAQLSATLIDYGATAPTPGADDASQLTVPGSPNSPHGLNYYFDNSTPPGQTFTTGTDTTDMC